MRLFPLLEPLINQEVTSRGRGEGEGLRFRDGNRQFRTHILLKHTLPLADVGTHTHAHAQAAHCSDTFINAVDLNVSGVIVNTFFELLFLLIYFHMMLKK